LEKQEDKAAKGCVVVSLSFLKAHERFQFLFSLPPCHHEYLLTCAKASLMTNEYIKSSSYPSAVSEFSGGGPGLGAGKILRGGNHTMDTPWHAGS
jgi:hypothetical protein